MGEVLDWGLFIATLAFAALSLWVMPRVWRNDSRFTDRLDQPPPRWPYSMAVWRGVVRSGPLGGFFFLALALFLAADRTLGESPVTEAFAWIGVVVLVLFGCVVLYNEPKQIVPPYLRHQPGLIAEWRGASVESPEQPRTDLEHGRE